VAVPAVERAAQVALLERVAHTALLEGAARPEQVTRTALLVFSPPAAQAKTLSTPRVRALARAPVRPLRTSKFSSESSRVIIMRSRAVNISALSKSPIASGPELWPSRSSTAGGC
jgi:hypothetical protein